jgi:ABC-2 type transport system ATP-binding protein
VLRRVHAGEVGARAFAAGLELHELAARDVGLEGIFLRLTDGGLAAAPPSGRPAGPPAGPPPAGAPAGPSPSGRGRHSDRTEAV